MTFETWMEKCRQEASLRGLPIHENLDELELDAWKSQFDNSMSPAEAVYYFMQTQVEVGYTQNLN